MATRKTDTEVPAEGTADQGDVGTVGEDAQVGPTAGDLRAAGYSVPDNVADDARAFAYAADTVITDPTDDLAVQELVVPVPPVDNKLTPAQFASQVASESADAADNTTTPAPTGGGVTEPTGGDQPQASE